MVYNRNTEPSFLRCDYLQALQTQHGSNVLLVQYPRATKGCTLGVYGGFVLKKRSRLLTLPLGYILVTPLLYKVYATVFFDGKPLLNCKTGDRSKLQLRLNPRLYHLLGHVTLGSEPGAV